MPINCTVVTDGHRTDSIDLGTLVMSFTITVQGCDTTSVFLRVSLFESSVAVGGQLFYLRAKLVTLLRYFNSNTHPSQSDINNTIAVP